jgi:hypothetical protein
VGILIYLHGFRSGPQSEKVRVPAEHLEQRGLADEMWCERLSPVPFEAIASIEAQIVALDCPRLRLPVRTLAAALHLTKRLHRIRLVSNRLRCSDLRHMANELGGAG